MGKTDIVKECGTSGVNYDLSNEDILNKLVTRDSKYGIEISDVAHVKSLTLLQFSMICGVKLRNRYVHSGTFQRRELRPYLGAH